MWRIVSVNAAVQGGLLLALVGALGVMALLSPGSVETDGPLAALGPVAWAVALVGIASWSADRTAPRPLEERLSTLWQRA